MMNHTILGYHHIRRYLAIMDMKTGLLRGLHTPSTQD
jgi:hypothetical protein